MIEEFIKDITFWAFFFGISFAYTLILIPAWWFLARGIKRKDWVLFKKRIVFSMIVSFFIYPVPAPSATCFPAIFANIFAFGHMTYFEGISGFMQMVDVYTQSPLPLLGLYLITVLLVMIPSIWIFKSKKESKNT